MNDQDTPPKRFIAGAVCPACGATDTIRMWNVEGVAQRSCAVCGFGDTLDEQGHARPNELPTRISQPKPGPAKPAGAPVRFFPNPKLKK